MADPADLLRRNRAWAARETAQDAGFFERLKNQQAPRYLWLGCSDSRVPANVIAGLDPGEVFVHRNIANVLPHTDLNALTVLEYAVSVLRVEHIIVCGHYDCGGVKAALDGHTHGLVDNWLRHVKDVAAKHAEALDATPDDLTRAARLAEFNAIEQARNVCHTSIVQEAWAKGQDLSVRAWIYGVGDGHLHDLRFVVRGPEDLTPAYRLSLEPSDSPTEDEATVRS
ncbi:MAG TPA: carbonic anhydrase [Trueperaceae bacterium]|nr:carbonic anhydrase [Trueperaceae bacterium]